MRIGQLSEEFFISGQVEPEHIALLAEQGFKTIVCNRPDGEDLRQPTAEEIAAAAEEHGMKFVHIPVLSNGVQPQDFEVFKAKYSEFDAPILAYCRTGARSAMLFQLYDAE